MATLRDELESAFDAAQDTEEEHERGQTEESRNAESVDRIIGQPESEVVADAERPEVQEDKPAKERDATGKFVKSAGGEKQPDGDKIPADGEQKKAEPVVPKSTVRPPVSWKPEVREKFASLPKEVQDEVFRREREVETTLRETAGARQFAQAINQGVQPYMAMIQAEGGNPVTAYDALLKTAYVLRNANPQQKAMAVAHMIMQHSVDVGMLDQALAGMASGQQAQLQSDPMAQYFQKEITPIKQFITGLQQRQSQLSQQQAVSAQEEYEAFANDPANEFFADVAGDMADFIDVATKNGRKMELSEAYQRAIMAHPEISKIVASRQVSARAAQRTAATRRAQNASASLPSGGAPARAAETQKPVNLRSAVEAAWEAVESRES